MGRLSGRRAARALTVLATLLLVGAITLPANRTVGQVPSPAAAIPAPAASAPGASAPGASAPPAASASAIAFDDPHARGDLGEDVVFETSFRATAPPLRVELVRGAPGDAVTAVSRAAFQPSGPDTWRARVVQTGHVAPNTAYRFHFRAVTADGRRVAGPEGFHRVSDPRFEWRKLVGDDVTVWWYEGDEFFAQRALDVAEAAVASASRLFGVAEVEPVDFFIYADDQAFRQALGPSTRENVGGEAHPAIDTLFGLIGPRQVDSDWVDELVTHELAHLVFDEATRNPYAYPPRWLNEGLAVHLSRGLDQGDRAQVAAAARNGSLIPLEGLAAQFPTRPDRFGLAYAESVSAVDRLIGRHGEAGVLRLVAALAQGDSLDDAFRAATGEGFTAFEDAWLASVGAERAEPFGPQAAPPGPAVDGGRPDLGPASGALLP